MSRWKGGKGSLNILASLAEKQKEMDVLLTGIKGGGFDIILFHSPEILTPYDFHMVVCLPSVSVSQ